MRKRTWTDEQFLESVKISRSVGEVLRNLGLKTTGSNYQTVKRTIIRLNVDISDWLGQGWLKGKTHNWSAKRPYEDILVEHSDYARSCLKKRLIKDKMIENSCAICGCGPTHNGKELVMILDHINGVGDDNRRENLRLVCPNCNSQLDTFSGRNKSFKQNEKFCIVCGNKISKGSDTGKCSHCSKVGKVHITQRKCERPDQETLKKEIEESNYCAVGRKYGVSDNAIRKWLK